MQRPFTNNTNSILWSLFLLDSHCNLRQYAIKLVPLFLHMTWFRNNCCIRDSSTLVCNASNCGDLRVSFMNSLFIKINSTKSLKCIFLGYSASIKVTDVSLPNFNNIWSLLMLTFLRLLLYSLWPLKRFHPFLQDLLLLLLHLHPSPTIGRHRPHRQHQPLV